MQELRWTPSILWLTGPLIGTANRPELQVCAAISHGCSTFVGTCMKGGEPTLCLAHAGYLWASLISLSDDALRDPNLGIAQLNFRSMRRG